MGLRFGRFELLPTERTLLEAGHPVALGARAFDLLSALIERRDRLVTKAELLDLVWPGLVVEEANLPVQISGLRKIIGPQGVATVPGLGYRFAMALDDDVDVVSPGHAPLPEASAARTNVPAATDILLGRDADLDALPRWLAEHRLITVLGAGGIGKTRVAQVAARATAGGFADGAWWVDLAALSSAEKIAPSIATAASLQLGDGDAMMELVRVLAPREMLLVLDNCEHLAGAVAQVVDAVLGGAARVRVLATSQEALRVDGEHLYLLSPLAVPPRGVSLATARGFPAVQLLEHRACAVDPRFTLTAANVDLAIDLCRQLDGLALAIEMAAARLPMLGLNGLHERLGDRLGLLRASSRDAPSRQKTLRATLDWSHGLLDANERAVLRRLAVFAGSFRLDAALQIAGFAGIGEDTALDALAGLVDKSFVSLEQLEPPRYRLAETTRLYARERLCEAGEVEAALRSHVGFMREFLEGAHRSWFTMPETAWRLRVEPELDNLRAALDGALAAGVEAAACIEIAALALPAWLNRDAQLQAEGLHYASRAMSLLTPQVPMRIEARLWFAVAVLSPYARLIEKQAALDRAVALSRTLGSGQDLCRVLIEYAKLLARMGRHSDADTVLDEADGVMDPAAPARLRGLSLLVRGLSRQIAGDLIEARRLHGRAADLFLCCGADSLTLCAINNHADAAWALGDLDGAIEGFSRAVERAREYPLSSADTVGVPLGNWAAALFEQDRVDEGFRRFREALPLLREVDKGWELCDALALGLVQVGRLGDAARVQGFADSVYAASAEARQPNEQRIRDHVLDRLRETFDENRLQQMHSDGALLSEDDALAIATSPGQWP
jgi:predicted ATPase/DNA-binding winged helix-turn-helix (wHTH) protein